MCGELHPWQWRQDVVVRMNSPATAVSNTSVNPWFAPGNVDPAVVVVPLIHMLEQVEEVWLTEYQIEKGSTTNTMWRLSLQDSGFMDLVDCNVGGSGIPLCVDTSTASCYRHYDNPRKFAASTRNGGLTSLNLRLVDETGQSVNFTSATFMLSFIMRKKDWSPADVAAADRNRVEWWRTNLNVGRFM